MRTQGAGSATNRSRLFTGASPYSRAFEFAAWAAAVGSALVVALLRPPAPVQSLLASWPLVILTTIVGGAAVAIGGIYQLRFSNKMSLSLGSGAAFALLLILPAHDALPAAVAGTLAAQLVRRRRGARLTGRTIAFNVAQYVVTWTTAVAMYTRVAAQPFAATPSAAWVPAASAGLVYILVNTWLVSAWSALRRRAWAWDVWIGFLTEAGPGYAGSLALGAGIAAAAAVHPAYVFAILAGLALAHVGMIQFQRVSLRHHVLLLSAIIDAAEQRSSRLAEHSERVAWWADRLGRAVGLPDAEAEQIALAAKLHDLSSIALGAGNGLTEPVHGAFPAEVLPYLPGFAPIARALHSQSESYDGSGAPEGLSGAAIPLASRIIAVAEHYVVASAAAPTSDHALADLRRLAGTRLDPRIVDALTALAREDVPWRLPVPALPQGALPALAAATAPAGAVAVHARWTSEAGPETDAPPAALGRIAPATILARLETERRQIGREIHDQIGAALTVLKCQLAAAKQAPSGEHDRALAATDDLLTRTIIQVQDLSSTLRPAGLDEHGLAPALASYIGRYSRQTNIRVAFSRDGRDEPYSPLVRAAAFRIVQEALTNVARHAKAAHARVALRLTAEALAIVVADAGVGFEVRDIASTSGLSGMRERAQLLGGTLTVRSAPGKGTTIEAVLPAWPVA